ncbi:unknown [Lactobacillus phage Lb338-1]|uniref:Uncharacterized protein n=1 Tax=Lactobacillus phage Lb338-1 TaxID=2892342 RepID=C1KFB3_9CAUD|nr:hypothetical protein lb338_phage_3 [Lactobacillus phage Lb338-1]ACO36924.1 unknown [Lactobacillus phage Lb338-1]
MGYGATSYLNNIPFRNSSRGNKDNKWLEPLALLG